jgi:hypothetical protein
LRIQPAVDRLFPVVVPVFDRLIRRVSKQLRLDDTAESIDAYLMRRSPCSMSKGFCQRSICSRTNRRKV